MNITTEQLLKVKKELDKHHDQYLRDMTKIFHGLPISVNEYQKHPFHIFVNKETWDKLNEFSSSDDQKMLAEETRIEYINESDSRIMADRTF